MKTHISVAQLLVSVIIVFGIAGFVGWKIGEHQSPNSATKNVDTKPRVTAATVIVKAPVMDVFHAQWLQEAKDAHSVLDNMLPDYPSARFKDVHGIYYLPGTAKTDFVLCGFINAKTKLGAYLGWIKFAVEYRSDTDIAVNIASTDDGDTIVSSLCRAHGRAGEELVAKDNADKARFMVYPTSEVLDEETKMLRQEIEGLKDVKPWPTLPAKIDRVTDYSKQISWTQQ